MLEGRKTVRPASVLNMIGSMIAYYIGPATGTSQGFLQAYSNHGTIELLGISTYHIFTTALALTIVFICKKYQLTNARECFIWFCGRYVGSAVHFYTVAFVACFMMQLISGAGSMLIQYYGVPYCTDAGILSLFRIMSVIFGFRKVIDTVSRIAPFTLVVLIIGFVASLISPVDGIEAGSAIVKSIMGISGIHPSRFVSTTLHSSYIILFVLPYFVNCYMMDRTATMKETMLRVVISFIALAVLIALMILSRIANIGVIIGTPAPNLAMTAYHALKMTGVLAFLVVAASFTTATPVAVIAAEYFAEADIKRFKIIGTVLVLAEFAISFLGSYAQIINILASVSGWVSAFTVIIAVIGCICRLTANKKVWYSLV